MFQRILVEDWQRVLTIISFTTNEIDPVFFSIYFFSLVMFGCRAVLMFLLIHSMVRFLMRSIAILSR